MSIDKLKTHLATGARANKYKVFIPIEGADDEKVDVLAKATTLPDATITPIEVWNQGRKLPIAGDATYAGTWDVTFYNSADLLIKSAVEDWMKSIDSVQDHTREKDAVGDYVIDMKVQQLDGKNSMVAEYTLYNCWPTAISAVDVADDAADTISEFTATFSFSHWVRTA